MGHDVCNKRKETHEQNLHKASAELWEHCTAAMKEKLEARTTFESDTCNNPIMLIKAIKDHSSCFEESRHEIASIFDTLKNYANCELKEKKHCLIAPKDLNYLQRS